MTHLTHFDEEGRARMVDVSEKSPTHRQAIAEGKVFMKEETLRMIRDRTASKGDVLGVARVAGIMAAKKTSELIPLCHPISLTSVGIEFTYDDEHYAVGIRSTVTTVGQTGVEMEALASVSVAALTIYDMCKAVDKEMVLSDIKLIEKRGGRSGVFRRTTP